MKGTPVWPAVDAETGLGSIDPPDARDLAPYGTIARRRAAELEANGFVVLRGLLDSEILEAWRSHVVASYLEADERRTAATPFTRTLDPEQPGGGTVQWGTGVVPSWRLSMEMAATLDALIGGLDRLVPWMSDYLSVSRYWPPPLAMASLRTMNRTEQIDAVMAALVATGPRLGHPFRDRLIRWMRPRLSWHLDETPARGRLEDQKLGVLGLVLLTDVDVEDGATAFLPDSPPRVARSLRDEPGRDQDDRGWAASIAKRCERQVLATGRAGDVYLLHPLTLHARAPAWRSSLRIVSNPNFLAKEPLSYRDPRSPVERYAARGL